MKTNETMAKSVIEKSRLVINKRNKRNRTLTLITVSVLITAAVVVLALTAAARFSEKPLDQPDETTAAAPATTEKDPAAEVSGQDPETCENTETQTAAETTDSSPDTHAEKDVVWSSAPESEDMCTGEWYGKTVHGHLYDVLMQPDVPDVVIAVQFVPYIEEDYLYNGKTYAEYQQEALDEIESEILAVQRYNAFKEYADMYIRIGTGKETDLGEYNWKLTWYDNMTEFFGEGFLSEYIEKDTPLYDKLEEDMKHLPTAARDGLSKARGEYLKTAIKEVEEMMTAQNIEYSERDDSVIIFVTAEQFKTVELGKYTGSDFFLASRYGTYDDM